MKLGSTNISTTTVANALQTSSHDVGTLCTHTNINKWSKWKPVRYATNTGITEEQLKSTNYGFNVSALNTVELSQMQNNTQVDWEYLRPTGGSSSPYRLGDFRNYNTEAQPPMMFYINNPGTTEWVMNTAEYGELPTIMVRYRLSDSVQSSGLNEVEIPMEDINMGTTVGDNIDNYLACVTYYKDGTLYLAQQEDTLGCRFGTNIDSNHIFLANFDLEDAFEDASDDNTHFPSGATNKQKLTLIPRVNMYTPASKGQVRKSSSNSPVTTTGLNGYYPSIYSFLPVPDATPLTIYRYSRSYIKVNYTRLNISDQRGFSVSNWQFSNSATNADIRNIGGQTIHFATSTVNATLYVDIRNDDTMAGYVRPQNVMSNIFPATSAARFRRASDGPTLNYVTTGIQIQPGQTVSCIVEFQWSQGQGPDFTYPSFSSTQYSTDTLTLFIEYLRTGQGWSDPTPASQIQVRYLYWR